MLKYLMKAYVMSVANYQETPGGVVEEQIKITDQNQNGTTIDDIYAKITEDGAITPEDAKYFAQISNEMKRISEIKGVEGEKIREIAKIAVQDYHGETQKIGLAKIAVQKQNERIATIQKPIKEFAKDMLTKAKILVNYSKNSDFVNKGFDIKIEDGKVVLLASNGKEIKHFTIPTMNEDGTINNEENLLRLNFPVEGFEDFTRKYTDVKTYAQIGQDNIEDSKNNERIAALDSEIKDYNKGILSNIQNNISELGELPVGIEVGFNPETNHVEITRNNKVIRYYTPNIKDTYGQVINTENIQKHNPIIFKQWVKENTK